jgi:transposase InsO family protein
MPTISSLKIRQLLRIEAHPQIAMGEDPSEGLPQVLVLDHGPEFVGQAVDAWAYPRGVKLRFIEPGQPIQNAFV